MRSTRNLKYRGRLQRIHHVRTDECTCTQRTYRRMDAGTSGQRRSLLSREQRSVSDRIPAHVRCSVHRRGRQKAIQSQLVMTPKRTPEVLPRGRARDVSHTQHILILQPTSHMQPEEAETAGSISISVFPVSGSFSVFPLRTRGSIRDGSYPERRHFSYAPIAGWSRHARRYDLGGALAKQGLVLPDHGERARRACPGFESRRPRRNEGNVTADNGHRCREGRCAGGRGCAGSDSNPTSARSVDGGISPKG